MRIAALMKKCSDAEDVRAKITDQLGITKVQFDRAERAWIREKKSLTAKWQALELARMYANPSNKWDVWDPGTLQGFVENRDGPKVACALNTAGAF